MTQEERWNAQYERMMEFMKTNHRRPSKHRLEEHDMLTSRGDRHRVMFSFLPLSVTSPFSSKSKANTGGNMRFLHKCLLVSKK